jgi:hypothetical protein
MHLRDYVVLSLIIMICFLTNLPLVVHHWVRHRNVVVENYDREKSLDGQKGRDSVRPPDPTAPYFYLDP